MYFDALVVGLARVFRCCLLVLSCVCKGFPCGERDLWRAVRVCLPKVLAAILFSKNKNKRSGRVRLPVRLATLASCFVSNA